MLVERIGQSAQTPWLLAFDPDVLIILRATLEAALPDEGCALLLGERKHQGWSLSVVWPCCNVWQPGMDALPETNTLGAEVPIQPSRRSRFALDPREQLHAQRWARQRGLQVIGSAHSHPNGEAVPSARDRCWVHQSTLMLLQGADQSLRAWWLEPEGAI